MRKLSDQEIAQISGGGGFYSRAYTFSFMVDCGIAVGTLGALGSMAYYGATVAVASHGFLGGVAVGAGYVAIKLTAQTLDNYLISATGLPF